MPHPVYDEEAVTEMVGAIMTAVTAGSPPASAIGPALGMALTELAKADGLALEELLTMVRDHHAVTTGALFRIGETNGRTD